MRTIAMTRSMAAARFLLCGETFFFRAPLLLAPPLTASCSDHCLAGAFCLEALLKGVEVLDAFHRELARREPGVRWTMESDQKMVHPKKSLGYPPKK